MKKSLIEGLKLVGIMTLVIFLWCGIDLIGPGEVVMNETEIVTRIVLSVSLYLNLKAYEKYKNLS